MVYNPLTIHGLTMDYSWLYNEAIYGLNIIIGLSSDHSWFVLRLY
jgi:hypothetical protein